jgi:site-specific DNA-methyltransferase (adenine-specific)/adenine-specific DNA-methyltransferase
MARQDKKAYELTDAEQRDLIALLQQGRPLPEKYRFILFEDKREVELVWNGKTRDVCTTVLPFQTLEHIDEPRIETKTQGDLFDSRGRQLRGWTNKLIWGDNKLILSSLKSGALRRQIEDAGGLKLIYIDPPFDVGADFSMDIEIGGETFHKEPNLLEQIAYRDTWGRGADSFIAMIYERLILMRDLLHNEGSIYVHTGPNVNHHMRAILSEVFGADRFEREIIWQRVSARSHGNYYPATHDSILFCRRGDRATWNQQYTPVRDELVESHYNNVEEGTGRKFTLDNCLNQNPDRPNLRYELNGHVRTWRWTKDKMDALIKERRIVFTSSGMPRFKRYLDESKGVPLQSIWSDIKPVNSQAGQDTGYSTQKPEDMLERILLSSSNEGDLVADFFCGSGTTAAVAEKLGRKWIATDLGKFGIHTTRKRLIGVQRELKAAEKNFRAFEVLNLGRYERQAYLNVGGRLTGAQKEQALAQKENEFRELILRAYKATAFGGSEGAGSATAPQDGFFHGARNGRLVVIGPINLPVGRLFVEEVITECRKRGATRVDVLAFEFEMGLFPAVLEEARGKGIDLTPKYIPAEVFDKRAVDKGQVVFHDISFVEATPRYDKKDKLTVQIELTDFSVYYTQGAFEAAIAAMKEGKSEVMCEQGQLYKVSKSKDGIVNKERLTRHWTDWVDYWAVDFDYMSRKEIIKVPVNAGVSGVLQPSPPAPLPQAGEGSTAAAFSIPLPLAGGGGQRPGEGPFEERWTGGYIFENEWQSFRTRRDRNLELTTAQHSYDRPGRYTVAVKVIDIFGNDTMTLVTVNVG